MALAALLGVAGLGAPASADAGSSTEGAAPSRPAYRVTLRTDATGTRWTGRETVTFATGRPSRCARSASACGATAPMAAARRRRPPRSRSATGRAEGPGDRHHRRPAGPGRTITTSVARQVWHFAWAAGPFRTGVATSPGGVKVRSHWTAGTPDAWVTAARAEAVRAIDDLRKRFGRYPYGEVDAVISDRLAPIGSMEFPCLVLVAADETGSGMLHELAHQWWYGIVGNDEYASPWLDESFATYSHDLLIGDHGESCAENVGWQDDTQAVTNSMGYWAAYGPGWSRFVYFNGACVLHDLEKVLGGPAMAAIWREHRIRTGKASSSRTNAKALPTLPPSARDRNRSLAVLHNPQTPPNTAALAGNICPIW
ncbi:M1 family aminopeptidase [Streptomyces sp. LARHCF249]